MLEESSMKLLVYREVFGFIDRFDWHDLVESLDRKEVERL